MGFAANGFGVHSPGQYGLVAAALTEVVLTFFLVLTVIGATDIKAPVGFAGFADWSCAGFDPPGWYSGDEYVG